MITTDTLGMPWAPDRRAYCAPGRLVVKLALGEAPESVPTVRDVRSGALAARWGVDGGPVDRVLSHFSRTVQVVRVHGAAASRGQRGQRHLRFDDLEHATGLARTFEVQVDRGTAVSDAVDALRQIGQVEAASPYYLTTQLGPVGLWSMTAAQGSASPRHDPHLPTERTHTSRESVRLREALALERGDPAVIVGVVDTGVDRGHPELGKHLRPGYDTVKLGARDMAASIRLLGDLNDEDRDPDDEVGHGTACAAIIGGGGVRLPPGLAGECSVLPLRVLGSAHFPGKDQPVGIGAMPDIDDGIKRCVDLGATVINLSLGTALSALEPDDPCPHADVVRYALARGVVLVAASGNSGREERVVPAALEGVIAVGAAGEDGGPAGFSTSGDHVALCAPGERIASAGIKGSYQAVTGTSFASPFVAAAAALMVSLGRRHSVPVGGRTVGRILRETARAWPAGTPPGHGAGALDAAAALARLEREIADDGASAAERVAVQYATLAEVAS
jgi:subtilisin family serine protease